MYTYQKVVSRLLPAFTLLLLASCGGGGGAEPPPPAAGSTFTLSTSVINVEAYHGGYSPATQSVTVQVVGTQTVYLGVAFDGPAVSNATLTIVDPYAGIARVDIQFAPTSGPGMATGNNSGTVTVTGCNDAQCNSQVSGSPKTINVNYTLKQFVSVSTLNFSGAESSPAPAAQTLTFGTDGPAGQSWTSGIQYLSGSAWLVLNRTSGSLPDTINVSVSVLPPGTYQASLTIATSGATPISNTVFITYVVTPALGVTSQVEFDLSPSTTAGQLSQSVTLQSNNGSNIAWVASTTEPWLTLSPASGDTTVANQLTVSLNSAVGIPLGKPTNTTTITITPTDPSLATRTINVWLHGTLPVVYSVNPVAIMPGSTNEAIILRGSGLDTSGISGRQLMAGTSVVGSFTSKGYSEIEASLPALAAGRYHVYLTNHLGLKLTWSELDVSAAAYSYAAIPSSGRKAKLIYSPHEKAVFSLDTLNGALRKFSYNAISASWSVQNLSFTGLGANQLRDMAMTPTAKDILVLDDQNMREVNPATLTQKWSLPRPVGPFVSYRFHQIGFVNHGTAYITTANNLDEGTYHYFYDDRTKQILGISTSSPFYKGVLSASGNGRRLVVGEDGDPAWANIAYFTSQEPAGNLTYTSLYVQLLSASV